MESYLLLFWIQSFRDDEYGKNKSTNRSYSRYEYQETKVRKRTKNKEIVTQLQLRGVDISTGTYSKVETGRNNPSVDLLIALTDILSCSFDSFFQK